MRTLAVDIDGCVLDFDSAFKSFLDAKQVKYNDKDYSFGLSNINELVQDFWQTKEFGALKPYDGIIDVLNKYNSKFDIVVVTALSEQYANVRINNLKTLKYKQIYFQPIDKAYFIIDYINPFIAIEDNPVYIKELHKSDINVLYPNRSYIPRNFEFGNCYESAQMLDEFLSFQLSH